MTSELIWQEEYNIGVDIIDKEHQRLFQIINRVLAFKDEEKKWPVGLPGRNQILQNPCSKAL